MTKTTRKELAQMVAAEMKKIRPTLDENRTVKVLLKGMTYDELETALAGYRRGY